MKARPWGWLVQLWAEKAWKGIQKLTLATILHPPSCHLFLWEGRGLLKRSPFPSSYCLHQSTGRSPCVIFRCNFAEQVGEADCNQQNPAYLRHGQGWRSGSGWPAVKTMASLRRNNQSPSYSSLSVRSGAAHLWFQNFGGREFKISLS